ncbi:Heterokaryon incompatibility protein 6, OR allele [Tolypocladium ophioglossoides CBS 100239]|uniref:Heterokaryon incompatibility protein 6, OR allele n=1 Tax=Tolypocladium ophioglossoides (strain CBS 100239) TaxID=1163406 RepID=A0A0L0N0Y3_TOLOC|nr:Heterokaryon incompatibility protein 6, OR allele [Tolypocladium ophioglossoides CBS 100239]
MPPFSFNSSPAFQYPPLDPSKKAFRLVRLLPPRPPLIPGAYGTVRVEIIEVNVDATPCYDALSYPWDVPAHLKAPNRQIIVEAEGGSYRLCVYRPLELALLHLLANNFTTRPLFVDQICINQDNDAEKSHQVQLMRDIYAKCARTVVWLGPATRASAQYFDYVHEIAHEGVMSRVMGPRLAHFMHVFDAVMDPSLEVNEEEREDRDDLLDMIRRFGHRFPVDGYADVLDRRWFNRLWIIQEACLAPVVVFVCGNHSLCFECFRAGALFYSLYNTHWVRGRSQATAQHEFRRRNAIFGKTAGLTRISQERRAIHRRGTRQGLYDLVLKYNINDDQAKIRSSLAEDRIFGLLGLAADDDPLRQRVRVRYKEVVQMYTEVAALLLEQSIDTLLFTQFPKRTGNLPSWVPDWAMDLAVPVGYSALKEPVFAAGGPQDGARFQLDEASRRLTIRGVWVDSIARVGGCTHRAELQPQILAQIDHRWASLFFDEASDFVREAAAARSGGGDADEAMQAAESMAALRLCDSGLSHRRFSDELGACAGPERLRALHSTISHLGRRLLKADETAAAYRLTRIYRTVGITPWYWVPGSEMDNLRICALDPVAAGKVACEALVDFITDMLGLCLASARMSWETHAIKFRRRFGKIVPKPEPRDLARVGVDPQLLGADLDAFTSNLLKNAGRRLYRTETGYLGLGPARMAPGDSMVVFRGGTVPHVLRGGRNGPWEYLGEAYCDGIMDGEALEAGVGVETSFILA